MFKMLKCAGSDDVITISAQDDVDRVTFVFESPSAPPCRGSTHAARAPACTSKHGWHQTITAGGAGVRALP